MKYYVYILFSIKIQKFYIGQTNDVHQRFKRHNAGTEKFTSKGVPWELVWYTNKDSRSDAIKPCPQCESPYGILFKRKSMPVQSIITNGTQMIVQMKKTSG